MDDILTRFDSTRESFDYFARIPGDASDFLDDGDGALRYVERRPYGRQDPQWASGRRDAEYLLLFEQFGDGALLLGRNGRIRTMSPRATDLMGCTSAEACGWTLATLFALESRAAVAGVLEEVLARGKVVALDAVGRTATGARLPLSLSLVPLAGSASLCAVLTVRKIKPVEEPLSTTYAAEGVGRALRLLRRFSHDMRAPLTTIIGLATLIADTQESAGAVTCAKYAHDIADAGVSLLETTLEHIALLETAAGEDGGHRGPVCLNSTIRDMLPEIKSKALGRGIITRKSLSGSIPQALLSGDGLPRLLQLLIDRAIAVTPAYGQILIATHADEHGWPVLCIRDGGPRLSVDQLADLTSLASDSPPDISAFAATGNDALRRAMMVADVNGGRLTVSPGPRLGSLVEVALAPDRKS